MEYPKVCNNCFEVIDKEFKDVYRIGYRHNPLKSTLLIMCSKKCFEELTNKVKLCQDKEALFNEIDKKVKQVQVDNVGILMA